MKRINLFPLCGALLAAGLLTAPAFTARASAAAPRTEDIARSISGKIARTTADQLTLHEMFTLNQYTIKPATLAVGDTIRVLYREEDGRHIATKVETMSSTAPPSRELLEIAGRIIDSTSDSLTVETVFSMSRETPQPKTLKEGEAVRVRYMDEGTQQVATMVEMMPARNAPYRR